MSEEETIPRNASFVELVYNDTKNTALRQALSTHLSVGEIASLVQVCTAFRSWLKDSGASLFLGITPLDTVGGGQVLRAWQPHLTLNGQPAMCKKKVVLVTPRIYSCCGQTADGLPMVSVVPRGANVDIGRSKICVRLLHANTHAEAELLLCATLFTKKKPLKGVQGPCYDTYHAGVQIQETLSRHRSPPGRYKLEVRALLVRKETGAALCDYVFTSDAFYVVAAPPKPGSATERSRRDGPHKRSRTV